jgi:hypothetical protein
MLRRMYTQAASAAGNDVPLIDEHDPRAHRN